MSYSIQELWEKACEFDKIPTGKKFAVFSENNYWAKQYNKTVSVYMKYQVSRMDLMH